MKTIISQIISQNFCKIGLNPDEELVELFCSNYWQNSQIAAAHYFQKQPEKPVPWCSKEIRKIHRKAPMLESLFNKFAGPEACFPVNFAKL